MCILENSDFESESEVPNSDTDLASETSEDESSSVENVFANFFFFSFQPP